MRARAQNARAPTSARATPPRRPSAAAPAARAASASHATQIQAAHVPRPPAWWARARRGCARSRRPAGHRALAAAATASAARAPATGAGAAREGDCFRPLVDSVVLVICPRARPLACRGYQGVAVSALWCWGKDGAAAFVCRNLLKHDAALFLAGLLLLGIAALHRQMQLAGACSGVGGFQVWSHASHERPPHLAADRSLCSLCSLSHLIIGGQPPPGSACVLSVATVASMLLDKVCASPGVACLSFSLAGCMFFHEA